MDSADVHDYPLERSWYIGNTCLAIIYGVQMCMFVLSVYFLNTSTSKASKSRIVYIAYGFALLILTTIAMAANLFYGQMMWIEHRDEPGGPVVYFATHITGASTSHPWYNTFGTAASVAADVLSNGLMLFRCYVFYGEPGYTRWMIYCLALVYLAAAAMSIAATIQSGLPGGDFFNGVTTNFTEAWLAMTIAFNIITTSLISVRLLRMSRSTRNVLGGDRAAPFTLLGIGYLITYIRNAPEALFFADVWGGFVAIAPQAIILRVAMGAGWSSQMVSEFTSGPGTVVHFVSQPRGRGTEPGSETALHTFSQTKDEDEFEERSANTSRGV
ncbi:hypothetical protein HMN09_00429000 [Mycena chlorophos]|uniref:Uncharacterized protein n=1 Tax=Mycena chlorophos TaxID=658473 RepID=A0A8H6THR6_MYCCL|nr:hypothetical protein HMN09_00429000 [Mycena chlorophos]